MKLDPDESASQCVLPLKGQKEKKKIWDLGLSKVFSRRSKGKSLSFIWKESSVTRNSSNHRSHALWRTVSLNWKTQKDVYRLHTEYRAPPIGHLKDNRTKQEKKKEKKNYLAGHSMKAADSQWWDICQHLFKTPVNHIHQL